MENILLWPFPLRNALQHLGGKREICNKKKHNEFKRKKKEQKTSDTSVHIIQEFLITQALKETLHWSL